MNGRPFTRRLLGDAGAARDPGEGLRVGEVLAGDGLPEGAAYLVGEPMPPRWGRLRFRGTERRSGAAVELWCAPLPGAPLAGPLMQLLPLRHRNLQPLLGLGRGPRDHAVAVLGLPDGGPLQLGGRPLSPPGALAVLAPLGRALDALHGAGLCHLELRPEHIYVGEEEGAVVLGGLGRAAAEARPPGVAALAASAGSRIIEGEGEDGEGAAPALLSVCAYLAPEQILPERAGLIHRRTDVYALSALGFHLLCGTPPFGPDGAMATLGAHLAAWRPLCSAYRPDLGEAVDAVLQRGLAVSPQARPPSCGELVDDLRAALASAPQPPVAAALQPQPCVLVVAGSASARRELQGMISAVSPRNPVLADGGAHAMTLALRYRPQLVLLHQPSLSEQEALSLCRRLCAEPALKTTQIVVQLQQLHGPCAQELAQLGVALTAGSSPSSSSSQNVQSPLSARSVDTRPLLQMLRRLLVPVSSRSTTRRPGP